MKSLFVFFGTTNGHQTNLLATEFDLKLIAGLEVKQGGVSLADQKISIALNGGDVAELASTFANASNARGAEADALGFQKCFVESGEVQTITTVLFVRDVATGAYEIRLADITKFFDFVEKVAPGEHWFKRIKHSQHSARSCRCAILSPEKFFSILLIAMARFVLWGTYSPDALQKRTPFREEHLARLQSLKDDGVLITLGPTEGSTHVFGIFEADAVGTVRQLVEDDVYWKQGIWTGFEVYPWIQAF